MDLDPLILNALYLYCVLINLEIKQKKKIVILEIVYLQF